MKCELENNTVVVSGTEHRIVPCRVLRYLLFYTKRDRILYEFIVYVLTLSCLGAVSTLSRSHSIASAGDKSLVVSKTIDIDKNPDRIMQELQYTKK